MPEDTGTALTAKPMPGSLTIAGQHGPMNIVPHNMAEAIEFARVMSKAGIMLRQPFRENPGACLAISLQAWRWSADPFAVANKAYMVNDQIAYESQLIHAIVNSSPLVARRLRPTYSGDGAKRRCKVTGWLRGEGEPFEYESPAIGDIKVKNSPLWASDPDQQLFYFASRSWARRHVPEILLGIYTTDEIDGQIIDVTADRIEAHAAGLQSVPVKTFTWAAADHTGEVYEFKTPENACDACRRILITAAAISPDALATAWDNNGEFIATLREAEYGSDADALERLHRELAPQDSPVADQPEQKGEATKAARNGPLNPSGHTAGDTPAPETPAQRPAAELPPNPPAAGRPLSEPPVPEPQHDRSAAETPATQRDEGEPSPQAEHSASQPAATATASAQTGDRHDPFWDRDSLRIDPPDSRTGKPDWKAWTALLIPRIRQAWSIPLLDELLDSNRPVIDQYAANFGSRPRDELLAEFAAAKNRL